MALDIHLTLVSLCTGTTVAVFLRYYLAALNWLTRVGLRACLKRLHAARATQSPRQRVVAVGDAVAATSLLTGLVLLFLPLLLFLVPIAFTAYAFTVTAQLVSIG
jgi:hypothetical protein